MAFAVVLGCRSSSHTRSSTQKIVQFCGIHSRSFRRSLDMTVRKQRTAILSIGARLRSVRIYLYGMSVARKKKKLDDEELIGRTEYKKLFTASTRHSIYVVGVK